MKKDVIIAVLATFVLTITLFAVIPINSQSIGDYDHWLDINDDGTIDMKDIAAVARAYGTDGTAINKTELLLELEQRISDLELVCLLMPEIRARLGNLERVSFFDDFNDRILDGWTQFPSEDRFAIQGSLIDERVLLGSGSIWPQIVVVDGIYVRNCVIETTLKILDGFRAGIIFGYINDTNYHFFFLSDEFDQLGLFNPSLGMINSTGPYTYPIYPEPWIYNLRAIIYENTYSLSINGTEVLTGTDIYYSSGQVGLCVHHGNASFDGFRVTELP